MSTSSKNNEYLYELIPTGDNIYNKELNSNNNTQRIIKDIKRSKYNITELIDLIASIGKAQNNAFCNDKDFNDEFNTSFKKWELSSNIYIGECKSMSRLNEWQIKLVSSLKQFETTKKITIKDEGKYFDIKVFVEGANARLTYDYSKVINKFIEKNDQIQILFCILSISSYNTDNDSIIVECD